MFRDIETASQHLNLLLQKWAAHLERHRAPSTAYNYPAGMGHLMAHLEKRIERPPELPDLTRKSLQAGVEAAPPGWARNCISAARSFFRWLLYVEEIDVRDASAGLVRPYRPAPPRPRILSVKEALSIVEAPLREGDGVEQLRDAAILLVLYGCGLRAFEVAGLDVDRVRTDAPRRGYCEVSVLSKGNRWDTIPAGRRVCQGLARYLARRAELVTDPAERALFLHGPGGPRAGQRISRHSVWRVVHRYVPEELRGLRVYPHLFRHTLASQLAARGANIVQVRDLMRHRSLRTTSTYLQPEDLLGAVDLHPLDAD